MTAFERGVSAIHGDPNFSSEGIYREAGGHSYPVTVILSHQDEEISLPGVNLGVTGPWRMAEIQVSQVALPVKWTGSPPYEVQGDRLELPPGGEVFKIVGARLGETGNEWIVDLSKI